MGKIYQGANLFADTSALGGGSVTPTILTVDDMSKVFNISATGSKTFYITNMLGSGQLIETSGSLNLYSTRIQIADGGNSIDQTFKDNFSERLSTDSDVSKFIATCPCTLTVTIQPVITPGNFITGTVINKISYV
jgi:hypothetical protein